MNLPHYHEDLKKLHVGTMPRRSYYVPASSSEIAQYSREGSDRAVFLSGDWAFSYHENDRTLPEGFYERDFDFGRFDVLPVPGCWQIYGYGRNNYTNVRYPIPFDPPYVPEDNPCGIYIREFELDDDRFLSATVRSRTVPRNSTSRKRCSPVRTGSRCSCTSGRTGPTLKTRTSFG